MPEMLAALVVIGILTAVVAPQIQVTRFKMDGAARGSMTALLAAQRSAVKHQHDVVVAFDTLYREIRIHQDANNNGAVDTGERIRRVTMDDGVQFGRGAAPARTAFAGTVSFTETQGGYPALRFHRNGSASQEGTFYLTSVRSAQGSGHAEDTRAVQIDRATGRASWFYYDPPEWKQGF